MSLEMRRVGGRALRMEGANVRDRSCKVRRSERDLIPPAAMNTIVDSSLYLSSLSRMKW